MRVLPTQKLIKLFLGEVQPQNLSASDHDNLLADEGIRFTGRLTLTNDLLNNAGVQRYNSMSVREEYGGKEEDSLREV